MTTTKSLLPCMLAAVSFPVWAGSMASVSASADSATCSQSGLTSAACSVSFPVGSQTESAAASATDTWAPGRLEATADGFGPNTNALANVAFSNSLIVTGASGSGDLQIIFSGFQMNTLNSPGGASVSPVGVSLGSFSRSAALPNGSPGNFSVVAPVTFDSATLFSVAFQANAAGTFFHDGTFARNSADGILNFPTFVVTDSSGKVIPGASVQFVPEPTSWFFVALGLLALPLALGAQKVRLTRPKCASSG